ncbi:MAG TPA: cupin domain-containing protein, partial [Opitutus sp.]|nr:cupin domain-containing protein [Opitutus sp.]
MRAVYEVVRKPENSSLKLWYSTGYRFRAPWHFHPEVEILLVTRGRGVRYVGDSVAAFHEGDLVMVGPDLPHVWISDSTSADDPRHVQCFIAQFR